MKSNNRIIQSVLFLLTISLFVGCSQGETDDEPGFYKKPKTEQNEAQSKDNLKAIRIVKDEDDVINDDSKSTPDILPNGHKSIGVATGDLDKDKIPERVVVYNTTRKVDMGDEREIRIFKKRNDEWELWHTSVGAVLPSEHGGMMGDPFEGITIERGAIVIKHFGGSNQKWTYTHRYRFQRNTWELIGATIKIGTPCQEMEVFDYNLSTGDYVYTKETERCDNSDKTISSIKEKKEKTRKIDKPKMDRFYPGDNKFIINTSTTMYY